MQNGPPDGSKTCRPKCLGVESASLKMAEAIGSGLVR
jgi:hypothetical protein